MKQLLITLTLVFSAQADWKQWRGPSGDGHTDANLPTRWGEDRNVKWRTPIPVSYTHLTLPTICSV